METLLDSTNPLAYAIIVGTQEQCPLCQQSDTTQKVSLLVDMIQGNISPREMDNLSYDETMGNAREWRDTPGTGSWEMLVKYLTPPARPALDLPPDGKWRTPGSRVIAGVALLAGFSCYGLLWSPWLAIGPLRLPMFLIIIIGGAVISVSLVTYYRNDEQKFDRWQQQMSKWHQLYYCVRDNVVFVAGKRASVPPEKIAELLVGHVFVE